MLKPNLLCARAFRHSVWCWCFGGIWLYFRGMLVVVMWCAVMWYVMSCGCEVMWGEVMYYKVLPGTTKYCKVPLRTAQYCSVRLRTSKHYNTVTTKYFKVLPRTTKNNKALYSVLPKKFPVLLRTKNTTRYYKIFRRNAPYYQVLLCTTKYYSALYFICVFLQYCVSSCWFSLFFW